MSNNRLWIYSSGFKSQIGNIKKHEINNILIHTQNNETIIKINTNSDIITAYIILKFFCINENNIHSIYTISADEKGLLTYTKDNHYYIQDMKLNDFLSFYSNKLTLNNHNSGFDTNTTTNTITGWRLVHKNNIKLTDNDLNFIEGKVENYKINKFKKKKYD